MKLFADYQQYNPFRQPSWRWERVLKLVDRWPTPGRCTPRDDDFIRKARAFLLRWRALDEENREELFWEHPGLFYAHEIFSRQGTDPEPVNFLQARLLSGQPVPEIAEALSTMPETVDWYEALFFNVKDRLQNHDWIIKQIIMPAFRRHTEAFQQNTQVQTPDQPMPFMSQAVALPFLDATLKLFAYCGGPVLVDVLIAGNQRTPLPSMEDLPAWLDKQWATTMRRRSYQASFQCEINKYNCMELFNLHARIIEGERSDDYREQARSTMESHIKSFLEQITWQVGPRGRKQLGSALARFDHLSGELRDDELLDVAADERVDELERELRDLEVPPPRKRLGGPGGLSGGAAAGGES